MIVDQLTARMVDPHGLSDVRGLAVHIGARAAALAEPSEVLVSSTVKDLVAGSAIEFDNRGMHVLKGIPGFNPHVIDELAAPGIRFEYSMHDPCRGRDEVRAFATKFRASFPDLNFWGTAELLGEGDYVVGQWEGGGTHTGPAFDDLPLGSLPASTGKRMHFTGTTVLRVENGLITEEIGLDDGVTVLKQLGIIPDA